MPSNLFAYMNKINLSIPPILLLALFPSFYTKFLGETGFLGKEHLHFGCLRFAGRHVLFTGLLSDRNGYTPDERLNVSTSLIQGRKITPNKGPWIRTLISEIWQYAEEIIMDIT